MLGHLKKILDKVEQNHNFQLIMYTEMHERFNELNDKIETYMSLVEGFNEPPKNDDKPDNEITGQVVIEGLKPKPYLVKLAEELQYKYCEIDESVVELANKTIELIMEHEDMTKWMKECTGYKDCWETFLLHTDRY